MQYQNLVNIVDANKSAFQNFDYKNDRLDIFFRNFIRKNNYFNVWCVFKIVFNMSHGQAAIKCGSSVNTQLLVENMNQKSLAVDIKKILNRKDSRKSQTATT